MSDDKKGRGLIDLEALRRMKGVHSLMDEKLATGLPRVEAPSLEGLAVTIARKLEYSEEELSERFDELAQTVAPRQPLAPGEPVSLGDEVVLGLVVLMNGQLVPSGADEALRMVLAPDPSVPGLWEAVAGSSVGTKREIPVSLPEDFPNPELRGAQAVFQVQLKEAYRIEVPDVDSPEFLQALGRGNSFDEVMESIAEDIENDLHEDLSDEAEARVMDLLLERADVLIPSALVDRELRERFESEARALERLEVAPERREQALQARLKDPAARAAAERHLKLGLVLDAIAERDQIAVSPELREHVVEDLAAAAGRSAEELQAELSRDPASAARVDRIARQLATVAHVMSKVDVQIVAPD